MGVLELNNMKNIGSLTGFSDTEFGISYINKNDNLPYAVYFDDSGSILNSSPFALSSDSTASFKYTTSC